MIENHGGTIVATGDGVRMYDLLSFRSALGLEIKTGMKMRGGFSVVKQAIRRGYVAEGTRRKADAYRQLDELIVSVGGQARPLSN